MTSARNLPVIGCTEIATWLIEKRFVPGNNPTTVKATTDLGTLVVISICLKTKQVKIVRPFAIDVDEAILKSLARKRNTRVCMQIYYMYGANFRKRAPIAALRDNLSV